MSILSMLLNPIPVPEPKKVRKVIDGIEVKPPRNKSEELPKQSLAALLPVRHKSAMKSSSA